MKAVWFAAAAAIALASPALAAKAPAHAKAAAAPAVSSTALVDAAQANDHATAMKLALAGKGVNATGGEAGATALLWAVHNDDAELVQALIKAGADVKKPNDFGDTPMREAAIAGDVVVLKALLDAGADVDSPSPEGQTSLMIVARTANVEAAKLLIERGAKVNAIENYQHETALMWAADQQQPEMVRLLVSKGADVNARSLEHENPVRVSAEPRVRYDPRGGMTALMFAAREGCVECAKILVEAGAKINARDPDDRTPLFLAAWNAHFDLASYLIKAGADVNRWDYWGRTPLFAAVDYNTIPIGGRADRPSTDETTPVELVKQLIAAGANVNAQLKWFGPYREPRNDRGGDNIYTTGATPLLRAARGGDVELVKILLAAGARTDLTPLRTWRDQVGGITPLMAAAGLNNQPNDTRGKYKTQPQSVEVIKALIASGADVNAKDDRGFTALHGAVLRGYNDVIKVLIDAGADPYVANNDGKTAMDLAKGANSGLRGQIIELNPDSAKIIAQLKPPPSPATPATPAEKKAQNTRISQR